MLRHRSHGPGWCAYTARRWAGRSLILPCSGPGGYTRIGLNVVLPSFRCTAPGPGACRRERCFRARTCSTTYMRPRRRCGTSGAWCPGYGRQEPESQIGLNGMSLGGYITSLVASLENGLACKILGVPVADIVGLLGRHAGLGPDDPRRQTVALAEPIGRMVSPLSLAPRVPMRGRFSTPASPIRSCTHASRSPPLEALGQTRNRLVPRRPHRSSARGRCSGS